MDDEGRQERRAVMEAAADRLRRRIEAAAAERAEALAQAVHASKDEEAMTAQEAVALLRRG